MILPPTRAIRYFNSSQRLLSSRLFSTSLKNEYDIVVVGGGPVGLFFASLMNNMTVHQRHDDRPRILVVEKSPSATCHPQAHFLNTRSIEIIKEWMPELYTRLNATAAPIQHWQHFEYCTGVSNRGSTSEDVIARVDQFSRAKSFHHIVSPVIPLHYPQHHFQPQLEAYVKSLDSITVLRNCNVVSADYENNQWKLRTSNSNEIIKCSTLIAADGASSTLRQIVLDSSDTLLKGTKGMQYLVNIHFSSNDLAKTLLQNDRAAMLYFIFSKSLIGILIAHDFATGDFVLQVPYLYPTESRVEDYTIEKCIKLIKRVLEPTSKDLVVHSVGDWRMDAVVATDYAKPNQSFYLIGDAAHAFPPSGALGMNTGLQDAHNLASKLISSDKSNSYEAERQAVARTNSSLSVLNFNRTLDIASSVFNVSFSLAKAVSNGLSQIGIPTPIVKTALDSGKALANSTLFGKKNVGRKVLEDQRDGLGLLFYQYDLGFTYDKSTQLVNSNISNADIVDVKDFQRITVGRRLPHVWLDLSDGDDGRSTIISSTLITGELYRRYGLDITNGLVLVSPEFFAKQKSSIIISKQVVVVIKTSSEMFLGDTAQLVLSYKNEGDSFWKNDTNSIYLRPDGHVQHINSL